MNYKKYCPVYDWGKDPDSVHGVTMATHTYSDLEYLYAYEPEAVGHIEVEFQIVSQNEFKQKLGTYSGAV